MDCASSSPDYALNGSAALSTSFPVTRWSCVAAGFGLMLMRKMTLAVGRVATSMRMTIPIATPRNAPSPERPAVVGKGDTEGGRTSVHVSGFNTRVHVHRFAGHYLGLTRNTHRSFFGLHIDTQSYRQTFIHDHEHTFFSNSLAFDCNDS